MTTAIEVLDTAIKIGLGAIIGGGFSLLLTVTNNKNQRSIKVTDDQRELLKQITLKLEKIESLNTEGAMHYHDQSLDESRKLNIEALDASRVVSAYANILGNDELVALAEQITRVLESMYQEFRSDICSEDRLYSYTVELEQVK